jgi:hypothetical protein
MTVEVATLSPRQAAAFTRKRPDRDPAARRAQHRRTTSHVSGHPSASWLVAAVVEVTIDATSR